MKSPLCLFRRQFNMLPGGLPRRLASLYGAVRRDVRGAVIVETAIVLPIVITLISGIITYGCWFNMAHGLQQAANEAARASLQGIDAGERRSLVDQAVDRTLSGNTTVDKQGVTTAVALSGSFYTVTLTYDVSRSPLLSAALVPVPGRTLQRSATVQLVTS